MAKRPKTGGRKKGTPNKTTSPVKELAKGYGLKVIETFAAILVDENAPHASRITAGRELLEHSIQQWDGSLSARQR